MKTDSFAILMLGACATFGVGTDQVQAAASGAPVMWGSSYLGLTWLLNGFALQSTADLTPPVTWTEATNTPALLGSWWAVTNGLSGQARFHRL